MLDLALARGALPDCPSTMQTSGRHVARGPALAGAGRGIAAPGRSDHRGAPAPVSAQRSSGEERRPPLVTARRPFGAQRRPRSSRGGARPDCPRRLRGHGGRRRPLQSWSGASPDSGQESPAAPLAQRLGVSDGRLANWQHARERRRGRRRCGSAHGGPALGRAPSTRSGQGGSTWQDPGAPPTCRRSGSFFEGGRRSGSWQLGLRSGSPGRRLLVPAGRRPRWRAFWDSTIWIMLNLLGHLTMFKSLQLRDHLVLNPAECPGMSQG
jgi:hypothetical protein